MHLSADLSIAASAVVTPVSGNYYIGGACYDGNGQALYAVYDGGGSFNVYRTRGSYTDLYVMDGSVDYLSTVLRATPAVGKPSTAIQNIGGTIYATISGWFTNLNAGTWIYRDTGGGGTGPWVLHGTIQAATAGGTDKNYDLGVTPSAGEILVTADLWATCAPSYATYGTGASRTGAVYTSADSGATWTKRLELGWGSYGIDGHAMARNFGQIGGAWYVGGAGNDAIAKHYKSTDLVTWTSIGTLDVNGPLGYSFPASDPEHLFRWAPSDSTIYTEPRLLQAAIAPPEQSPAWSNVEEAKLRYFDGGTDDFSYPLLCNIGPDKGLALVATNFGQVLGIALRPTGQPPCRRYPRDDGLASSSARRHYPSPQSRQGGYRQAGYY